MRIAVIDGHPDPEPERLCHALADAYADGAQAGGHNIRRLGVAGMNLPLLRSEAEFRSDAVPEFAQQAQELVGWAEHLVLVYPLWLGTMPAAVKALLEQTLRPAFAIDYSGKWPIGRLKGRSARVVVTMGMPALAYRWYYGAHSLKSLERNVLKFCGIKPVRESLYGMVAHAGQAKREGWLAEMRKLGERGR